MAVCLSCYKIMNSELNARLHPACITGWFEENYLGLKSKQDNKVNLQPQPDSSSGPGCPPIADGSKPAETLSGGVFQIPGEDTPVQTPQPK
jgi:hypothetical protein